MNDKSFQRFGAICAALSAIALFAMALVLFQSAGGGTSTAAILAERVRAPLANWLLVVAGLATTAAVIALYLRLRDAGPAWAAWATLLGVLGGVLTALHGLWDALRYPVLVAAWQDEAHQGAVRVMSYLPSPVDPRGVGLSLFVAVFLLVAGRLILTSGRLSRLTGQLALLDGVLLILLFIVSVSRTLSDVANLRSGLAALAVGLLLPIWWLLVARELWAEDDA